MAGAKAALPEKFTVSNPLNDDTEQTDVKVINPMIMAQALGAEDEPAPEGGGSGGGAKREQDTKLGQKLGQLQFFLAVFPQECTGQPASSGPT